MSKVNLFDIEDSFMDTRGAPLPWNKGRIKMDTRKAKRLLPKIEKGTYIGMTTVWAARLQEALMRVIELEKGAKKK